MGSQGSSVSQAEIEQAQQAAKLREQARDNAAKRKANELSAASAGKSVGGEGSSDDGSSGALSKAKAKKSTLAGMGEATFSDKTSKLGS